MRVFFVQHGESLSKEIDETRPLSTKGKTDSERVARSLHLSGVSVLSVCHSGKLRARQTAEIFAEVLRVGNLQAVSGMNPNDDVTNFVGQLRPDTMYVGHLPHMEKLVSYLVVDNPDKRISTFHNSGVLCLEHSESGYHIQWAIIPEICGT